MKHQTGNTILEYSLIGLLIALGCMVGCLSFGKNFANAISGLKTEMSTRNQLAIEASKNAKMLSSTNPSSGSSGTSSKLGLTSEEQTLLEQPLSDKLQTTGANGTTELLAKQLELLAAQLLADGKITEEQSDAILRLANQGHYMAHLESLIEQASGQSTVVMDGQTYSTWDLASRLGFMAIPPDGFATADVFSSDYTGNQEVELAKFIALYKEVMASGAASDPLVSSTILNASVQIVNIGESMEDAIYRDSNGYDLKNQLASRVTQMNSSRICTSGNFTDNGLLCKP
jgi:hypothetical protein